MTRASLRCPLCDYDLRGLVEPRCPECGYGAPTWEILRERVRTTHPFLFEHQPDRNVPSFIRTLAMGLLPWKFWRSVQPHHEIRPRRLIVYWLITSALALLPLGGILLVSARDYATHTSAWRGRILRDWQALPREQQEIVLREFGTFERGLDILLPAPPAIGFFRDTVRNTPVLRVLLSLVLLCVAFPWLLMLSMRLFGTTLRAAKIRPIQILRCGIYCADIVAWLGPLLAAMALTMYFRSSGPGITFGQLMGWQIWILVTGGVLSLAAFLIISIRVAFAFRTYLRLRHAIMTAALVQIMIGLAWAALQRLFD